MSTWSHFRRRAGYTLTELLVVCALVGLLLVMAIPTLAVARDNAQLRGATSVLAADIRFAQEKAVRESKKSRVLFDTASGVYRVQVAKGGTADISCTDDPSLYNTIKEVDLASEYRVGVSSPTFRSPSDPNLGCVLFEPSGRTDWINPMFRPGTTLSDEGVNVMVRYLDSKHVADLDPVSFSPRAIYWTGWAVPVDGTVRIVLDFGTNRYVDSICPQMIEDLATAGGEFAFPNSFRVFSAIRTDDNVPATAEWTLVREVQRADYAEERITAQWARACPEVSLGTTTRYIMLELEAADGGSGPSLAIDEIKIPWPEVTLQNLNGRASRRVVVTPNTGMVSIR